MIRAAYASAGASATDPDPLRQGRRTKRIAVMFGTPGGRPTRFSPDPDAPPWKIPTRPPVYPSNLVWAAQLRSFAQLAAKARFSCVASIPATLKPRPRCDAAKVPSSGGDVDGRRRRPSCGFQPLSATLRRVSARSGLGAGGVDDPKLAHQARQRNRRGAGNSQTEPSPSASSRRLPSPLTRRRSRNASAPRARAAPSTAPAKNAPADARRRQDETRVPPPAGTRGSSTLLGLRN